MTKECIFCEVAKSNEPHHEIIWENNNHIAFLDMNPSKRGHTLLIPKKHSISHLDLNSKEYSELFLAVKEVSELLKNKIKSKLISVVLEGSSISHTHVHLIPLNDNEKLAHFDNFSVSKKELSKIADEIRK